MSKDISQKKAIKRGQAELKMSFLYEDPFIPPVEITDTQTPQLLTSPNTENISLKNTPWVNGNLKLRQDETKNETGKGKTFKSTDSLLNFFSQINLYLTYIVRQTKQ